MSLNTIEFPKHIIADLYKNFLIEKGTSTQPGETKSQKSVWKFLGENKRKMLILVKYNDAVHLPDNQLGFLTNLLSACKLNLGDTAVLNYQKHTGTKFSELITYFEAKTILLFGVSPEEIGMPMLFPYFQVQVFNESTFLYSPALDEIEMDKVLKSKLWLCFKKIFGL